MMTTSYSNRATALPFLIVVEISPGRRENGTGAAFRDGHVSRRVVPSAVHEERDAGDVLGGREEEHRVRDVVGRAEAPERRPLGDAAGRPPRAGPGGGGRVGGFFGGRGGGGRALHRAPARFVDAGGGEGGPRLEAHVIGDVHDRA